MRRTMMTAVAILLLAGCDGGRRDVADPAAANATANAGSESVANRLAELPEGQRNAVFIRAIQDAGLDCQHVESSRPAGDYQGDPVWSAHCADGGNWTVVIRPDGTAVLLDADERRLIGVNAAAPQNSQGR